MDAVDCFQLLLDVLDSDDPGVVSLVLAEMGEICEIGRPADPKTMARINTLVNRGDEIAMKVVGIMGVPTPEVLDGVSKVLREAQQGGKKKLAREAARALCRLLKHVMEQSAAFQQAQAQAQARAQSREPGGSGIVIPHPVLRHPLKE